MKKIKGSLSLEAVISFTIFISFMFVMLTMVKLSLVRITLNTATTETAKQIATASYPLSHVIEWQRTQNERLETYQQRMNLMEGISEASEGTAIFGSGDQRTTFGSILDGVTNLSLTLDRIRTAGISGLQDFVGNVYSRAGSVIACNIFNTYIDNSGIAFDKEKLDLTIVKFPQAEGCSYGINADLCEAAGITADSYAEEDVVISVEYKYTIAMPFFPSIEVTMRETAIEHPWIYGGGASPVERGDKSLLEMGEGFLATIFGNNRVYLGAMLTGKKYHTKDCRTLWKGSIMSSKEQAIADGYSACGVCRPQ